MTRRFDCFVIFAEMRTGSNFLESNLDLFPGLTTYGEAFNPYFMVRPGTEALFGLTLDARNDDPVALLTLMKTHTSGLPGFRFFHDHDRRIFEHVIDDPRVAKVVLTRNFVDAYVSRAIAQATAIAAGITLLTGAVVLIGAAAAGQRARTYEAAILKTLGATRGTILASFALRSALMGAAAGGVAIGFGAAAGFAVMHFVMDVSYRFEPVSALAIVAGGVAATLLAGLIFALPALGARPARVLRATE